MFPDGISYVDGGKLDYEPSVFAHFDKILRSPSTNIAIKVAHQQADYLDGFKKQLKTQSPTINNVNSLSLSCLSWTYEQLHHAAVQVVHSLRLRNVTVGCSVVCLVPNGIEWAIVLWASILGKFTLSCLDFGALSTPRAHELQMLLRTIKPDVIFVPNEDGANAIDIVLISQKMMPKAKIMFQPRCSEQEQPTADSDPNIWIHLHDLAVKDMSKSTSSSIEEEALIDDHSRKALILFTSGTTAGTPKGCLHTVRESLHFMKQNWDNGSIRPPCRLVQTANFRTIAPTLAMSTWADGGTVVLPSAMYDPQAILAALCDEEFAITSCLFIPAQLHDIVAQDNFSAVSEQVVRHGSLNVVSLGGDIITEGLYTKACNSFPGVSIRVAHGMTEGGASFTWPAGYTSPPFHAGIAPVGKTNDGTRLRIAAAAAENSRDGGQQRGVSMRRGESGELHFWNEGMTRGYLDGMNAQDFYSDDNGDRWFDTGDIALMDEEGWVYILGRKRDIIKRAGIPITPGAIESSLDTYLRSHTSVVGVPHSILGQAPVAVVKSMGHSTKESVKQHVIAKFGPDYGLGDVLTLQELNLVDFPINATGKILKRELLDRIASLT